MNWENLRFLRVGCKSRIIRTRKMYLIRTIFIDITARKERESYRLLEIRFNDDKFDEIEVVSACEYRID